MAPLRRLPAHAPHPASVCPHQSGSGSLVSRSYSGLLVDSGHHSGNDGAHAGGGDDNDDGNGGMTMVVLTMLG